MTTPPLGALYAAGFVTAFGAHSIAAGAGADTESLGLTVLGLGLLLAVYDLAEVVLKPVFGVLSDRVGQKPVILGGLIGFAVVSVAGVWAVGPIALALVRFGQGACASAFSPSSSAAVSRLVSKDRAGRYFGRYGSWKGLGYAAGPVLGAVLLTTSGSRALFLVLAGLAAVTAVWVAVSIPTLEPLPKRRFTVVDLGRQLTDPGFLVPTLALATATGALGAAVGFLPALGRTVGLGVIGATAAVTVLAVVSSVTQPVVGRLLDSGRVHVAVGVPVGIVVLSAGLAVAALIPSPAVIFASAVVLGVGIGAVTPLGFAHLAATTPDDRIGRVMGSAELGRETGDAAGPLVVGAVAAASSIPAGLGVLALLGLVAAALSTRLGAARVRE
ncbi:MFS transporter [Frondihabitans peucedani]|uniref:Major facilitator superfamily (MFS) profile domain-containing protein n=1 Tax=Frondihabitans peucedani TaxID=598626 RepID=A0ABP8E4W7_9MICO